MRLFHSKNSHCIPEHYGMQNLKFNYCSVNFSWFSVISCVFTICSILYRMSIASPNEKKRYFSATAVLYACMVLSYPRNAETSIISVLSGK